MDRRVAPAFFAILLAGIAVLFAPAQTQVEELAGQICEPEHGDKVFFAMQIADESGAVLAEPKLVGMCGVPVEMTLADPGSAEEPRMSLWLEPQPGADGSYEVAFELSVPGRVKKGKGSVRVRPGEERTAKVSYPGGHLSVQLAAFAVPSAELQLYLQHGLEKLLVPGRT